MKVGIQMISLNQEIENQKGTLSFLQSLQKYSLQT